MTTIKIRAFGRLIEKEQMLIHSNWFKYGLFFCLALFFSQAIILEAVAPFFLAFWLIVQQRYPAYQLATLIGGIIGTSFLSLGQALAILCVIVLVELLLRLRFFALRPLSGLLLVMLVVQIVWQTFFYSGIPPFLVQVYVLYELFFAAITFVLMRQFFLEPYKFMAEWTTERVIAGCVVLALMITGMHGMTVYYFSLAVITLHVAICLAAVVGGLPASLLIAVVVGMLSGIAQLSFTGMLALYAVTGVLVGLMERAGRVVVVLASFLPSIFFLLYDATLPLDVVYFVSIICAGLIVLLIPKRVIERTVQLYTAQTTQLELAVTTPQNQLSSLQQFVSFLKGLVTEQFMLATPTAQKAVPLPACAGCYRYEHCWRTGAMKAPIEQWVAAKTLQKPFDVLRAEEQLKGKCVKPQKVIEQLYDTLYEAQMNGRFYHGKKMLALQLSDLSEHLQQLVENQQSKVWKQADEQALIEYLASHHITCTYARFQQNERGERIVVCRVVHAHMDLLGQRMSEWVTAFLDEPLVVQQIAHYTTPYPFTELHFHSAIRYELAYDVYKRTEQMSNVSGDSYSVFTLQPGVEVLMLSDGMGTSYRAKRESERVIQMMKDCLSYEMSPETAMHTVHYILSLKNASDLYATLDFALVDLKRGELWCWKAGGMTTYILRGSDMMKLESNAAPMGFMMNGSVETTYEQLQADDAIVMVSDGVFSTKENWQKQEQLLLQYIRHSMKKHGQPNVALYEAMAQYEQRFTIEDDCTVMLFSVKSLMKEWSVYKPEQLK